MPTLFPFTSIQPGDRCQYPECESAGRYAAADAMLYCHTHFYYDLRSCQWCGEREPHTRPAGWHTVENLLICPRCEADGRHRCSHCDAVTLEPREYEGACYCEECFEDEVPYNECCDTRGACTCPHDRVHPWDWKPRPVFFQSTRRIDKRGADSGPYFGFELEIQCYAAELSDCVDVVDQRADLYCKHDGSLTDGDGFEIVSHPMTWAYLMEHRHEFAACWRKLIQLGARSYDTPTCGLHIHHSRDGYTKLQLLKVQRLVCGNSEFTLRVSQRQRARLDTYASLTAEPTGRYVHKARFGINQRDDGYGRRVAVNLENPDTVEYRLFRGTLRPSGFFKAIEYVQALYEFTRNMSIDSCTAHEFTQYCLYHHKRFPCLSYFLQHKQNMPEALFAQLGVRRAASALTELTAA